MEFDQLNLGFLSGLNLLVVRFDKETWSPDAINNTFKEIKKMYPKTNAICVPMGIDFNWMTEEEFDIWTKQIKESMWGGSCKSGTNA